MKKIIFALAIFININSVSAVQDDKFEQMLQKQIQNIEVLQEKISSEQSITEVGKRKCIRNIKTQIKWLRNQEKPFDQKSISAFVSREQKSNQKCIELIKNSHLKQLEGKIERLNIMITKLKSDGKSVEDLEALLKQAESKIPLLQK